MSTQRTAFPKESPPPGDWWVRVPISFRDDRKNPVPKRYRAMLILLDGRSREKPYCWVGNREGAEEYGCTPGHFRLLIAEMDRLKLVSRVVETTGDGTQRFGIILRTRVDDSLPIARTEEEVSKATEALKSSASVAKSARGGARKSARGGSAFSATELESCRESDELLNQKIVETDSRRRQEPEAAPIILATVEVPRAATLPADLPPANPMLVAAPALVIVGEPGQAVAEFLASLDANQRERWEQWSPERRAEASKTIEIGLGKSILRELSTKAAPVAPPPDAPTPELIAALSGPMGGHLAARCADAILSELRDRNRARSFGPVYKLCQEVANKTRDPESLARPLAKTLEAVARGEPIINPGGYWTRGVQNFERES